MKFCCPGHALRCEGNEFEAKKEFIISQMSSYEDIMTIEFAKLTIMFRPVYADDESQRTGCQ